MAKPACAIWPWGTETREQLETALADISDIGYKFYESTKGTLDIYTDASEFDELNQKYGVRPVSFYFGMTGSEDSDVGDIRRALPYMSRLGVESISLQAGGVSGRPANPGELDYTRRVFNEIGRICTEYGILPCIHPHVNTFIMYESEIDYIMENTDPGKVFFGPDTAHLKGGMCDPVAIFERYKSRIRFTHMKDLADFKAVAAGMDAGVEVYKNFLELGEGTVNFCGVFDVLKSVGYSGCLTAELDQSRYGNKISAKMNYDYIIKNY